MKTSLEASTQPRSLLALWTQILGPPVVWLTQFELRYALAGSHVAIRHNLLLLAIAIVSAAVIVLIGVFARESARIAAASPLDAAAGVTSRNRFMAQVGLMLCGLFFVVIVAQAIADFYFQPGER